MPLIRYGFVKGVGGIDDKVPVMFDEQIDVARLSALQAAKTDLDRALFDQLELTKGHRPDRSADSLGGTVNLKTRSSLNMKERRRLTYSLSARIAPSFTEQIPMRDDHPDFAALILGNTVVIKPSEVTSASAPGKKFYAPIAFIDPNLNPMTRTVLLPKFPFDLAAVPKITIVACGTAFFAGMVAKYWFEQVAKVPVEIDVSFARSRGSRLSVATAGVRRSGWRD